MTPAEIAAAGSIVTIVKDILTGIAVVVGAVVATMGVTTWKRQLRGNAEYERARRMLRATYETREAIRYVRAPFITVEEMSAAFKEEGIEPTDAHKEGERAAYQVRWKKIAEARVNFSTELLDAESLWGSEIRQHGEELLKCVGELSWALSMWLRRSEMPERIEKDVYGKIYDAGTDNTFTAKINAVIERIETYVRPHLKP